MDSPHLGLCPHFERRVWMNVCSDLPPPPTHTHKRTCTHIYTHTHTNKHTNTHTHTAMNFTMKCNWCMIYSRKVDRNNLLSIFLTLQFRYDRWSYMEFTTDIDVHVLHVRVKKKNLTLLIVNNSKSLKVILLKVTQCIAELCTIFLGMILLQDLCALFHSFSLILKLTFKMLSKTKVM